MIYRIDDKIFEAFPSFCRGVVTLTGVNNSDPEIPLLEKLFRDRLRQVTANEEISVEHQRINAWCEIYKTFSVKDAHRIKPSVASLIKRIKKGDQIPFISPLVCISNLISLTYLVPSGLIDIDKVTGTLYLGTADGSESFIPIGDDKTINPVPGEIIYYDTGNKNVMCRAWNSRGGRATFILPNTKNAVLDVDGLTNVILEDEIKQATIEAAKLVSKFCGGNVNTYFLNKNNRAIEF